jgi:hypothetical protein
MITTKDLRAISRERLRDARALLPEKRPDGAYYVCVYPVGLAPLKIPTKQFRKAMREIAAKNGDFTLFALFQRANGLGSWDLVVAAPWLKTGGCRDISKVVDGMEEAIGRKHFRHLAQVAVVDEKQPEVKSILAGLPVEDGEVHLGRNDLFGHEMLQAVIFRAMKPRAHRKR